MNRPYLVAVPSFEPEPQTIDEVVNDIVVEAMMAGKLQFPTKNVTAVDLDRAVRMYMPALAEAYYRDSRQDKD